MSAHSTQGSQFLVGRIGLLEIGIIGGGANNFGRRYFFNTRCDVQVLVNGRSLFFIQMGIMKVGCRFGDLDRLRGVGGIHDVESSHARRLKRTQRGRNVYVYRYVTVIEKKGMEDGEKTWGF